MPRHFNISAQEKQNTWTFLNRNVLLLHFDRFTWIHVHLSWPPNDCCYCSASWSLSPTEARMPQQTHSYTQRSSDFHSTTKHTEYFNQKVSLYSKSNKEIKWTSKLQIFVGTCLTFPIKVVWVKKLLHKQTRHTGLLNCPPPLASKVSKPSHITLDPSSHFRP